MIKFLRDHVTATHHYRKGAVVELPDDEEDGYVEAGAAEKTKPKGRNVRAKKDK